MKVTGAAVFQLGWLVDVSWGAATPNLNISIRFIV